MPFILACFQPRSMSLGAGSRRTARSRERPRLQKTRCFDTFPFPDATADQQARIRALAEQLDAHRKRQQAPHPDLTLTGMYNVLEKLRFGEPLTAKDKTIHEQGLVSVLAQLHDELDAAVFDAYGWSDLAPALASASPAAPRRIPTSPPPRPRPKRSCCRAWSRSTPNAPPRKRAAWCAGCAPISRTPAAPRRHRVK